MSQGSLLVLVCCVCQGFNLKLVERLGYVSEELLGQPIKTLMSVEQEKSHGSWEVVVRTYFSQIFETGRQFPYHVAVLPHANQVSDKHRRQQRSRTITASSRRSFFSFCFPSLTLRLCLCFVFRSTSFRVS